MRRSKVELAGLVSRVIQMYSQGQTLKEIEKALRSEGYDISRESIRRTVKSSQEAAKEYKKAFEEAKAIVEAVRDNPNTDAYEAITSLLASKMLDNIKNIEAIDFDDPIKMTEAVAKLSRAQVSLSKLRLEYQKGFKEAKKAVINALKDALKEHKKLSEQLVKLVDSLEVPGV